MVPRCTARPMWPDQGSTCWCRCLRQPLGPVRTAREGPRAFCLPGRREPPLRAGCEPPTPATTAIAPPRKLPFARRVDPPRDQAVAGQVHRKRHSLRGHSGNSLPKTFGCRVEVLPVGEICHELVGAQDPAQVTSDLEAIRRVLLTEQLDDSVERFPQATYFRAKVQLVARLACFGPPGPRSPLEPVLVGAARLYGVSACRRKLQTAVLGVEPEIVSDRLPGWERTSPSGGYGSGIVPVDPL